MTKRLPTALTLIAALILGLSACTGGNVSPQEPPGDEAPPSGAATKTVTDANGRVVEFESTPKTLIAADTMLRLVAYMGLADQVVGVENNELKPEITRVYSWVHKDRFPSLPVIGQFDKGSSTPNVEAILQVAPDVIIARWDGPLADDVSKTTGIPVVTIPFYQDPFEESFYDSFKLLGEVFDKQDRAQELVDALKNAKHDLSSRTADIDAAARPTNYIGGVNFNGRHGFAGTFAAYPPFDAINALNVVDETGHTGALTIDLEKVIAWDPDNIFLDPSNLDLANGEYKDKPDVFNSLRAVRDGRIYPQLSYNNASVNVELALANAYYAGTVIYPEQFADVDPAAKFDELTELFLGVPLYEEFSANGLGFEPLKLG